MDVLMAIPYCTVVEKKRSYSLSPLPARRAPLWWAPLQAVVHNTPLRPVSLFAARPSTCKGVVRLEADVGLAAVEFP